MSPINQETAEKVVVWTDEDMINAQMSVENEGHRSSSPDLDMYGVSDTSGRVRKGAPRY